MVDGNVIDTSDLPPKLRDATRIGFEAKSDKNSFYDQVSEFEKKILIQSYESSEGNMSKLALKLGMDRSHLYTKLREYGIHSGKNKNLIEHFRLPKYHRSTVIKSVVCDLKEVARSVIKF